MNRQGNSKQAGFSLLELTVVLFVIAMVLGGLLGPLGTRVEQGERKSTDSELKAVEEALLGFAVGNGRLPCPDCPNATVGTCTAAIADDGVEDFVVGGDCMVDGNGGGNNVGDLVAGNLPWTTLGLAQQDPWARPYVYSVVDAYADDIDGTNSAAGCIVTPGVSFELCSDFVINGGDPAIVIEDGGFPAGTGSAPIASFIPAIVISHGSNGRIDPTTGVIATASAYETENTDGDLLFYQRGFGRSTNTEFDDIMVWISPHVLHNRMIMTGQLP